MYIETSSVTRKARNVADRPSATFLVQAQASSGPTLMVAGEGSATVVAGEEAQEINRRLRAKYLIPGALDAITYDQAWLPED